tara:strand:- start:498 stop:653 length:156 start_codon:yes stop_codon:yes gene_type:complete
MKDVGFSGQLDSIIRKRQIQKQYKKEKQKKITNFFLSFFDFYLTNRIYEYL